MASKFSKAAFKADELLLLHLYKKAGYKDSDLKTLLRAVRNGNLAMEAMFETAVARVGQIKRVDLPGMDHEDGSDCKKVTVVNQGTIENPSLGAGFSVENKYGVIRAIVVEPLTKTIYYFKFPPKYYLNRKTKKKNIRISFSNEGGPPNLNRRNAKTAREIWSYQVKSFKELCS
jgi:hypothetical protein